MSLTSETADLARGGALAVATQWGARIGARLIPGAGWALLAYDGASLTSAVYEGVTGEKFADTKVGAVTEKYTHAVEAVASTAGNAGFTGASALLSFCGMKDAARFVDRDARFFVMGETGEKATAPHKDAEPRFAALRETTATESDLPTTDAQPTSGADRARIAAAGRGFAEGPALTLEQASARSTRPTAHLDPIRAEASRDRIQWLIASSEAPSELDKLAALAIEASDRQRPPQHPRANTNNNDRSIA
jgi:hypothetical protein